MSDELQRRYLPRGAKPPKLEERADGAPPRITGYAAVFYRDGDAGTEFEMWPQDDYGPRVVERIMPGAFDKAIRDDDVVGLFNHSPDHVLGRTGAGTVRLSVDAVGLRYEIDPPDTQTARDLLANLRRGDIKGSSFAFLPRSSKQQRREEGGKLVEVVIERHDVQLFDVGPVTFPAYAGATSGVRSAAGVESVRRELAREDARRDADRLAVELALMDCED